jgi:hypothetical protein
MEEKIILKVLDSCQQVINKPETLKDKATLINLGKNACMQER